MWLSSKKSNMVKVVLLAYCTFSILLLLSACAGVTVTDIETEVARYNEVVATMQNALTDTKHIEGEVHSDLVELAKLGVVSEGVFSLVVDLGVLSAVSEVDESVSSVVWVEGDTHFFVNLRDADILQTIDFSTESSTIKLLLKVYWQDGVITGVERLITA